MIAVRPAVFDDTPFLVLLRQERTVLLQQSDPRLTALMDDTFASVLSNDACRVWVAVDTQAEQGARPVGYIVGCYGRCSFGSLPPDVGLIADLTLDAHRYHGGAGRLLFAALKAQLQQLAQNQNNQQTGFSLIVAVPRFYAVEQAFWRSLGAVEDPSPLFAPPPARVWMKL